MLVNLVNKYGVVPKNAFPESSSSEAALLMNKFLRTKVYLLIKKIINIYLFIYL
jgi:aminopeptidase C